VNARSSGLSHLSGEPGKSALTTSDVARIFSVHPCTVRRWCNGGKIKFHRAGPHGARLFKREDIAVAYLDRNIRSFLKKI
jgi:excisionase family DNA binding protein